MPDLQVLLADDLGPALSLGLSLMQRDPEFFELGVRPLLIIEEP